VRAKRITRGYKGRTLPHFEEGNILPEACGFVESSFKTGLTPLEYFFHAMGGREGLVDKGIRTAKSGYMQRRLINALLDLYVNEDGTVRDSGGIIIQFLYGEDSLHPMKCIGGSFIDWSKYFRDEEQETSVIDRVETIEFEEGESMEDLVDSIDN
jgi:DNA-directed RNA polymerase subunit A'